MSYLEMALRIGRKLDAPNAGSSSETRPTSTSARGPVTRAEEPKRGELAACGSHHCAGCYEVEPGVRIHPPKSSAEWVAWLERWEPKGRQQ